MASCTTVIGGGMRGGIFTKMDKNRMTRINVSKL